MIGVVLKVRYSPIEIHDFKIMLTEHLKTFLTLEESDDPYQHSKGYIQLEQPLKHFAFEGIRRITDDVVTLRRINGEKILTVCNMCCDNGIATLPKELYKQTILSVKRTPNCHGGVEDTCTTG